jgi:hypothetical protein
MWRHDPARQPQVAASGDTSAAGIIFLPPGSVTGL